MALLKTHELESGVVASYWRIVEIRLSIDLRTAAVKIAGYLDEAARRGDREAVVTREYVAQASEFDGAFSNAILDTRNPVAAGYLYLKGVDDFAQAEDV